MKQRIFLFVLIFLLLLTGCNGNETSKKSESKTRIISLIPSNTEILYELGLYKEMIGVSTVDDYPKQVEEKEKFDGMKLDYEALLKAKPTMIFAHESMAKSQEKTLKKLRSKGIKVIVVNDADSFDALYESIRQIAQATNKEAQGDTLIKDMKRQIKETTLKYKHKVSGKKVFVEISSQPEIYTAGNHTLINDVLKQLGADNIFSGIEGYQAVSTEAIVKKNPDVIVSISGASNKDLKQEIKTRNGFNKVNAVNNNHIHAIDPNIVSRPGPRVAQGMEVLAKAIADET
ncbi:ABC transporter substrate-binding protein [Macrococcoides caseolyticum]|uniref:ABC transporter substrate-binding protein n=1 Tax=Macrococcoides caseolyticum TaxID=69966 RepID=UPI001F1AA93D|nr:ABC transporter substrate-binding protein [Macrococcus caseolyticus]MCE4957768.1 ABC transporter substrate-binding protein [Macrococcus caseolyticus]